MVKRKLTAAPAKQQAKVDSSGVLAGLKRDMLLHVEMLEKIRLEYDQMGSPPIAVMQGNYYNALRKIRDFTQKQIIDKMMKKAQGHGATSRATTAKLYGLIAEIDVKMPVLPEKMPSRR